MFCEVSDSDYKAFWENGYISFRAMTTPQEVARILAIYDQLFVDRAALENGDLVDFASTNAIGKAAAQVPQVLNPSKYDKRLETTEFRKNCLAVAQRLLGPKAELVFEHAMVKPAITGGVTSWHQDAAFHDKYTDYDSATFWMPLQDVDLSNGCMEFIPGSHKGPLLPHRSIGNNPQIHGLEAIGVDPSLAIPVFLPAGGVSVHLSKTLHYAGPNPSPAPRRAYALVFGVRSRKATLWKEHPWNVERRAHMLKARGVSERRDFSATERMWIYAKGMAKSLF